MWPSGQCLEDYGRRTEFICYLGTSQPKGTLAAAQKRLDPSQGSICISLQRNWPCYMINQSNSDEEPFVFPVIGKNALTGMKTESDIHCHFSLCKTVVVLSYINLNFYELIPNLIQGWIPSHGPALLDVNTAPKKLRAPKRFSLLESSLVYQNSMELIERKITCHDII